jgi:hypothetical protein
MSRWAVTSWPSVCRCCHPLTLGRRLEQNAQARPTPEHRRQPIARRRDPSVDDSTILQDDPDLTFLLVKIDGSIFHGWSSPVRLTSAFSDVERKLPPH